MKRRNFIKTTAAGTSLIVLNSTSRAVEPNNSEEITHYVLFWLKKDLSEQQVKDFTGFFEMLKTIPVVKSMKFGRAAATNKRDVVDNSFTYNLVATFKNMQDIASYENHPIHLAAIEKYSSAWEKVVVHDSVIA